MPLLEDTRPISLRAPQRQIDLIDRAAHASGKNRTEFMLETATQAAEAVLLDTRLFVADDDMFKRFMDRLDAPPSPNPELRRLLRTKAPWEK